MTIKQILLSGTQDYLLYHTTKLRYMDSILRSDTLIATSQSNGTRCVSLTRHKDMVRIYRENGNYARLVLDRQKLEHRFKVIPYSENEHGKDEQFEEHVDRNIDNLHKYLIDIQIIAKFPFKESELDSVEYLRKLGYKV